MKVSARFFLGVAAFLLVATVVYVIVSSDDVGAVVLLASGIMAASIGTYLERGLRAQARARAEVPEGAPAAEVDVEPYLPHASVWPWWLGVGALFLGLGVVFGLWAFIPGLLLTARGVYGSAVESRTRA